MPKIKVNEVDMTSFTLDQMIIDPYWKDLYNPPKKDKLNHIKQYIK